MVTDQLSLVGIGSVAQPVSKEVQRQDRDDHRDDREHQPGIDGHGVDVLGLIQKHTPTRNWWAESESEEGQGRLIVSPLAGETTERGIMQRRSRIPLGTKGARVASLPFDKLHIGVVVDYEGS